MKLARRGPEINSISRWITVGIGITLVSLSLVYATFLETSRDHAIKTVPAPKVEQQEFDVDGFPKVDWDYWLSVNSDIIGWVTVPGTEVNYPIVQAPVFDPQYYLWHDVYNKWNYMGCPYLDSDCAEFGLFGNRNTVVSGHNLGHGDDSMFAAFAEYSNETFSQEHTFMQLQSPTHKQVLKVGATACIRGDEPAKRTKFLNDSDFSSWLEKTISEANTVADVSIISEEAVFTFATCSYSFWDNERSIVFFYASNSN